MKRLGVLSWLSVLLATGGVGCVHAAATGSGSEAMPTTTSEAPLASAEEPGVTSDPAQDVADAEEEPLPVDEPAGTLAEQLNRAGVHAIAAGQRGDEEGVEDPVRALAFADRRSSTFCTTVEQEPRCWALPFAAGYVAPIVLSAADGTYEASLSFGHPEAGYVVLSALRDRLTVAWIRPGMPDQRVAVREVEPPPLFEQAEGLQLLMQGVTLLAYEDATVHVCERGEAGFSCTDPTTLPLLQMDGHVALTSVRVDFPGVVGIEYGWGEQLGDVYTEGQAIVFVRITGATLLQLAHVYLSYTHVARTRLDSDDLDVIGADGVDVEQRQEGCVHVSSPILTRTIERPDGATRRARPPALRRAPNTVPPDGLDPLTYTLAGAWALEPEGGLRRVASCEYEG